MKKSVSKKMFALSVFMSAGMLLTGCSGTGSRTLGEYTDGKQHRGDAGECRSGRIRDKPYQREAV